MHRTNWDDLRFVLAVAESGSVSGASRVLGVNHATVLRRISAFEEAQGTAVFDRTAQGYTILPDKLRVIHAARRAATAIDQVDQLLRGSVGSAVERIRVTSTDTLCQTVLPQVLAQMSPEFGEVDLCCTNDHIDLSRLRADVAVRPTLELPADLTGEVAGELGFAVYARVGSTPRNWLSLSGVLGRSQPAQWMIDTLDPDQMVGGADSFVVLREMAAYSDNLSILPCCLGDMDDRLVRQDIALPTQGAPVWVACHNDLASVPRLAKFRHALVEALRGLDSVLVGAPN